MEYSFDNAISRMLRFGWYLVAFFSVIQRVRLSVKARILVAYILSQQETVWRMTRCSGMSAAKFDLWDELGVSLEIYSSVLSNGS